MDALIRMHLFGRPRVLFEHSLVARMPSRGTEKLFVFLILGRNQLYSREALTEVLWARADREQARHRLRTAIWRLRKLLEPSGIPPGAYLRTNLRGDVGFNADSDYWLDLEAFEAAAGKARTSGGRDIDTTVRDLGLYRTDYLSGLYDNWAIREQERVRCLYLRGLGCLIEHFSGQSAFDRALEFGRKLVDMDPLREDAHRTLMRLYALVGDRAQALRQYRACRDILGRELGIRPMVETEALSRLLCQPDGAWGKGEDRGYPVREMQAVLLQMRKQFDEVFRLLEKVRR